MEYNCLMQQLLNRAYRAGVKPQLPQRIWKKKTVDGNDFYGIGDFCGMIANQRKNVGSLDYVEGVTAYGSELTKLEWDGNELYFKENEQQELEKKIVSAYLGLKQQMEREFPEIIFDIVVSVAKDSNYGTIRFYAVRDQYHYIEPSHDNLSGFKDEAILIDTINRLSAEKLIPQLVERFKTYRFKIQQTEQKEVRFKNPYCDEDVCIAWDDEEFTMYFGSFHAHYGEDEWEDMMNDIEEIVSGLRIAIRVESEGRWVQSSMEVLEELRAMTDSQMLKHLFAYQKDMYKHIKKNGADIFVEAWNPEYNRKYRIDRNGIKD